MPLTKVEDIRVEVRRYKDRDGQDKSVYETIGARFQDEQGRQRYAIKRTFNPAGVDVPAGSDSIWGYGSTPNNNQRNNQQRANNNQNNNNQQQQQTPPLQQHNGEFSAFDPSSFQGTGQNTSSGFPPF